MHLLCPSKRSRKSSCGGDYECPISRWNDLGLPEMSSKNRFVDVYMTPKSRKLSSFFSKFRRIVQEASHDLLGWFGNGYTCPRLLLDEI